MAPVVLQTTLWLPNTRIKTMKEFRLLLLWIALCVPVFLIMIVSTALYIFIITPIEIATSKASFFIYAKKILRRD